MQRVAIARALVTGPEAVLCDEPTGNLDSGTSQEILSLLRGLPASGKHTVVMVTHDPQAAAFGDRLIRIRDGLIVGDEAPFEPRSRNPVLKKKTGFETEHEAPARRRRRYGLRSLSRTAGMGLRSLRRNALRSALTTLGIVIGVASLIAIAEIGQGAWTAIREMLTVVNRHHVHPPLPERELMTIAASAARYAPGNEDDEATDLLLARALGVTA